eukprot:GHRQ01028767.1.p1 GENE.GHRQ01028767.1~~GHRQ01028767.1.p1  ORF type:complete len:146 (+),score=13.17 GHRQ01028767.1:185-622(+)
MHCACWGMKAIEPFKLYSRRVACCLPAAVGHEAAQHCQQGFMFPLHDCHFCHLRQLPLPRPARPLCCVVRQLNVVQFSVAGLGMLTGSLTVKASYEVASDERVAIKFIESTLVRGCFWMLCTGCACNRVPGLGRPRSACRRQPAP